MRYDVFAMLKVLQKTDVRFLCRGLKSRPRAQSLVSCAGFLSSLFKALELTGVRHSNLVLM